MGGSLFGGVRPRRALVAAVVFVLAYAVLLITRVLPGGWTTGVDDLGQLAAAALAAGCCAAAAARALPGAARWAWGLLAAGTGAWAAGEGVWSYYELVAGRDVPFPSWADAGFLAFPLLTAVGLLVLPLGRDALTSGLRNLLDGLVNAGSLLILSWASTLGATVAAGGSTPLATTLAVAYPLGDVVVLTLVLLVVGRAPRGHRAVLVPLAAGLMALAFADSSFLYLTLRGSYASGNLLGIGWTGGFVLVAFAALAATEAGSGDRATDPERARLPSRARLALPYLPLLAAQAVVTRELLTGDHRAPAFEVVLALVLVALVLTRQFLTLADNRGLVVALQVEREAARHASLHDPLTGLANRTLFMDRVDHALALRTRDESTTTVMFCDLDDFKTVNDSLGHAAGDALLIAVADRLRTCLRPADTVGRLGGDEFAVLIEGGAEPPSQVAARLVDALGEPVMLAGRSVTVTVSVGLATTSTAADDCLEGPELLRRADSAMYLAKRSGKARWVDDDLAQREVRRDPPARVPEQGSDGRSGVDLVR